MRVIQKVSLDRSVRQMYLEVMNGGGIIGDERISESVSTFAELDRE